MILHRGRLQASGKKFAVVVSRFNEFITRRLWQGAVEVLEQAGASARSIETIWVPGALEIPQFCKKAARLGRFDAVIALACVLRGQTRHFECVAQELTRGISQAALETGVPMATGVITADTLDQAMDRAGLKSGNKGRDAALAALELAGLDETLTGVRKGKRS